MGGVTVGEKLGERDAGLAEEGAKVLNSIDGVRGVGPPEGLVEMGTMVSAKVGVKLNGFDVGLEEGAMDIGKIVGTLLVEREDGVADGGPLTDEMSIEKITRCEIQLYAFIYQLDCCYVRKKMVELYLPYFYGRKRKQRLQ